jgi:processive 1,2-diacylglycerol beta-glucosyltransferase
MTPGPRARRHRQIGRPREAGAPDPASGIQRRILVVSASMGAGHDGAARELAARLRADGHVAEVRDFLDAGPLRIGSLLKRSYEFELRHVPSAYDATYRFWYRVPWMAPVVSWLVAGLTRRRLLRWVRRLRADVVVSTYPLSTLCLGRLRRTGALRVPAVNFITDFGVHPLWVHRGIDLNLAVHAGPARQARLRTGQPSIACGPMVSDAYRPDRAAPGARAEARARWGLADSEQAVLVVAGSWGIGGIRNTFSAIAADGRFTPVVVCGKDEAVRRDLAKLAAASPGRSVIVGWTDEMPSLMTACDALVENAGGLTSLEAMRSGLPVVSFQPIAGHGVENTSTMAEMGVSRLAADVPGLLDALGTLCRLGPERSAQVARATSMFISDAASLTLGAVQTGAPTRSARRAVGLAARSATATAGVLGLTWAGLTTGVSVAAATGAGVAHPVASSTNVTYIGVRLDGAELASPATRQLLARMAVTAVVDEQTANADPVALRALAVTGLDVANGGRGFVRNPDGTIERPAEWTRAHSDVDAASKLSRMIGEAVTEFVPGRRVNAFDMVDSSDAHATVVIPNHVLTVGDPDDNPLSGTTIYLVDGLGATPTQLDGLLNQLQGSLTASHLIAAPFAALQ